MSHCLLVQKNSPVWRNFAQTLARQLEADVLLDVRQWKQKWKELDYRFLTILGDQVELFHAGRYRFFSDFRYSDPNEDGIPEVIVSRCPLPLYFSASSPTKRLCFYTSRPPNSEWVAPLLQRGYTLSVVLHHTVEPLNEANIIIHFNGHGDEHSWRSNTETGSQILLTASDVQPISLSNHPFVFSGVCITASPRSQMLRAFLQAGAAAYLGFSGPLFGVPKAKEHPGLLMDLKIFENMGVAETTGELLFKTQNEFIEEERLASLLQHIHHSTTLLPQKMKSVMTVMEFLLFGSSVSPL